jgi:hypothetical protein
MKFKEIVDSTKIDSKYLIKQYYEDSSVEEQEHLIKGYNKVLKILRNIKPFTPDEEDRIQLCIRYTSVDEDDNFEPYYSVDGYNPKDKEDPYYAIEFSPWSEWLDMDIEENTLKILSNSEILVHALWEMTFISWDEEEIKGEWDKIEKAGKEFEGCFEEQLNNKLNYKEY